MPLTAVTATDNNRRPTVIYNAADGSGRTYGAKVERLAVRPTTPTTFSNVTTQTTGGTLGAAVITEYKYTVVVNGVESLPNTTTGTVTTGGTSTNTVTLEMPAIAGAQSFRIYTTVARTAGTRLLLATVGANVGAVTTYVDTGAVTPAGAEPAGALTSGAAVLRIPSIGSSGLRTIVADPATAPGQVGKYEYYRL